MAAPADITIKDLSGEWTMDKTLSNPTEPILALQGMGWMKRKALNIATVTLSVHQHADEKDPKVLHVKIEQTVTGGIPGTTEYRITDWEGREHEDHVFGNVRGQSRLIRGSKGDDGKFRPNVEIATKTDDEDVKKFLKGEILADGKDTEGFVADNVGEEYGEGEGLFLQSFVQNLDSNGGWTAEQIWGFELIDGKRYYTRRVVVAKEGKYEKARFVYTFIKRRGE
ncbi:hypothetical protein ANOM_001040 [Aspergillus nomiae NRRL 13137]|uniref:Uncharacterized protein n=1 Tax=Aspergillus nomiae NRRL (strain ATCC 15546 / NRRL 13137 / CBS 260.88 / M93) TaxID=1509407 RepID=A0A0L1JF97_ASPN3|nr:uncharacterized protein ANOM_001040 [Aspergillus nomiae NRRL 13137]KNG90406.1 hypothetical protein ANOM_001040 [Aspergillus nomiae NRRL 13137]